MPDERRREALRERAVERRVRPPQTLLRLLEGGGVPERREEGLALLRRVARQHADGLPARDALERADRRLEARALGGHDLRAEVEPLARQPPDSRDDDLAQLAQAGETRARRVPRAVVEERLDPGLGRGFDAERVLREHDGVGAQVRGEPRVPRASGPGAEPDRGLADLADGNLRDGVEPPQPLDPVPEQLDPQRALRDRVEDVDQIAPDGVLARRRDDGHPLEARGRDPRDEVLDRRGGADREAQAAAIERVG